MNRHLILTDYAQIDLLERNHPELMDSCRVTCVSPLAAIEWASRGRSTVLASELLSPEAIAAVDDTAYEISRTWFAHLGDLLVFDDIDLGELIALDYLMFLKQALGSDLLCGRLLIEKPDEFILFRPRGRACADGAAFKDEHDVFEASLIWKAEACGVPIRFLDLPRVPHVEASPPSNDRDPLRISCLEFEPNGKPLVTTFGGGVDLVRYLPYLDILDESGRYQTLALSNESRLETGTTRSGLGQANRVYMSIQDFVRGADPGAKWAERLDEARRRDGEFFRTGPDSVLNNPHLNFQWDYIWERHFSTSLKWMRMFQRFFRRFQPAVALSDEGSYYLYRLFLWVAKQYGAATVSLPHGNMINYPHYLHFEADRLFCSGRAMLDAAVDKAGRTPERIEIIGDLTMTRAVRRKAVSASSTGRRKTVFFTDQRYVNYTLCQMNPAAYLRAWGDLFEYARTRPHVDLLIKPHPSYGYRDWQVAQAARMGLGNVGIVEDKKVEELLARTDVAFMMGRISNAGLTTIEMGVPILFYDGLSRVPSYGDYLWTPDNGILSVKDRAGLFSVLDRLLSDPEFVRSTVNAQRAVVHNLYTGITNRVADRFLDAVDRLWREADQSPQMQGGKVGWA